MPPLLPLSSERLVRHGLFLIEDGQTMFLWIGRDAVPQLVMDVFDIPSYDQLPSGKVRRFHSLTHFNHSCSTFPSQPTPRRNRETDILFTDRSPSHLWTISSLNASTRSLPKRASCVGVHTGPTSTLYAKTASQHSAYGPSAPSSMIGRIRHRVINSTLIC